MMNNLLKICFLLILITCSSVILNPEWSYAIDIEREYKVKAAFIFNIIQFIDWQNKKFDAPNTPIRICVFGDNPFGQKLTPITKRQSQGHKLTLEYFNTLTEADGCHVVFISKSERKRLPELIETFQEKGVLTIGDTSDFARMGGIVGLVVKEKRVSIEINLKASKQTKLKISAKLLEAARIVK